MGTYLQGVQSIIPSIQPHDPGINMVANLLQLKQNQYDTNYKSLNKMYGQFYYADLTRDDNIQKRDNTVQQIDFDLKRIAGLDLSSEQNVQQASQIFKPFYEDGALMKDMAWTKNFNNTLGAAQGLLKSDDEKVRGQHWDDGVKELQYKREEFKNASAEEAMMMGSPEYTPYVNVQEKMLKLKKDANLSFEKTSMSENGKWILKNKNGQLLVEPLANLFEAQLGADPAVQKVYKTQAYVNRKDFAYGEAEKHGGVKEAEMFYLEDAYGKMKSITEKRHADKQANTKVYDAKIADIEAQIKEKGSDPLLERELAQYREGKETNDAILGKLDQQLAQFNSAYSSSGNTSTGTFQNPYKDVDQLRRVVDGNMADTLMNQDIMDASTHLAYTEAKEDFKENPYAVLDVKHAQQMAEINQAGSWRYKTETLKGQNSLNAIKARAYYDEYTYSGDKKEPKSGSKSGSTGGKKVSYEELANANATANSPTATVADKVKAAETMKKFEEQNNPTDDFIVVDSGKDGGSTDQQNSAETEKFATTSLFDQKGKASFSKLMDMYAQLLKAGKMTKEQFATLTLPKGEALIPKGMENHPAYSGKAYQEVNKIFSDPLALKEKVAKEGVEFILKNTNVEGADITKAPTLMKRMKSQGYEYGTAKWSKKDEDNYLMRVVQNGANYIALNPKISAVEQAVDQGLNESLADAAIISRNMQDARSWRYKTRDLIVEDMTKNLQNNPDMIRDFGTAIFDRNGKYVRTDMSRLKEELKNMYTESGTLNPDYKPKTNYQIELDKIKYSKASNSGKSVLGAPDLFNTGEDAENFVSNDNAVSGDYVRQNLATATNPYRYSGNAAIDPSDLSAKFADQFIKSANKIYTDTDSRHVISELGIPGYKKVGDGGTGITANALLTKVDLKKGGAGAIAFYQFGKDWANLRNKIDGVESVISFEGAGALGFTSALANSSSRLAESTSGIGKKLLDDYMEWTKKHGTSANAFDMRAQRIAANNVKLGAMKFQLPEKFLKEMLQEEKNPGGYLSQTNYDALVKNGLSVIAPNNNFNNLLHNSTMSPLQSHVEYNNEYTWQHPTGLGSYTIRKGGDSEPDYVTETILKDYSGKQVGSLINNSTMFGANLENDLNENIGTLNEWATRGLKQSSMQSQNIRMNTPASNQAKEAPAAAVPQEKSFSLGQPD